MLTDVDSDEAEKQEKRLPFFQKQGQI